MTLLTHSSLTFNNDIFTNPNVVFGEFLGQIFGNALLEKVLFRGFLLVQIYLLLKKSITILHALVMQCLSHNLSLPLYISQIGSIQD